jgi:hypothetical protein
MFFALAATAEENREIEELLSTPSEETELSCSCKKKKKTATREELLLTCEHDEEVLEEEKTV